MHQGKEMTRPPCESLIYGCPPGVKTERHIQQKLMNNLKLLISDSFHSSLFQI